MSYWGRITFLELQPRQDATVGWTSISDFRVPRYCKKHTPRTVCRNLKGPESLVIGTVRLAAQDTVLAYSIDSLFMLTIVLLFVYKYHHNINSRSTDPLS